MPKPDSAPCPGCTTVNSVYVSRCRNCGEFLPWAKPQAAPPPVAPAPQNFAPAPPPYPVGFPAPPMPAKRGALSYDLGPILCKIFGALMVAIGGFGFLASMWLLMHGVFKFSMGSVFFISVGMWLWNKGSQTSR